MSSGRPSPHLRQFAPVRYKKAPQAPRRFKSSYMFFSTTKHKEIRAELTAKGQGQKLSTTEVAKMVSIAWKALPEDEREKWEELARQDKARYEMEKSMYTGPWKVPATKRINKDPKAPKRPMSAFLSFSNSKRQYVKNKHKDVKNAEVSRILAQMWKDADAEEKKMFVDGEFRLRQEY
ncbi:HMG-box, partial [Fragilariopsis cylindrus CCMP1102]